MRLKRLWQLVTYNLALLMMLLHFCKFRWDLSSMHLMYLLYVVVVFVVLIPANIAIFIIVASRKTRIA